MNGVPFILLSTMSALVGIYFGGKFATQNESVEGIKNNETEIAQPLFVTPDIFVYPLHAGNKLTGYFVARFVLPLAIGGDEKSEFPDDAITSDAFYAAMFSMRSPSGTLDSIPSMEKLTSAFIGSANVNAGYPRYEGALLQQFDYFEPDAMRRKNVRDRNTEADFEVAKPQSTH
jgi:hypothetical protein